jgi:hypothetical protein
MTYCLKTEDGKIKVEIRCTLANRPTTVGEFVLGVREGRIELIKPKSLPKAVREDKSAVDDSRELDTDWEATGGQARYINWIPIENL